MVFQRGVSSKPLIFNAKVQQLKKSIRILINEFAQQGDAPETVSPRIIATSPSRKNPNDTAPVVLALGSARQFEANIFSV